MEIDYINDTLSQPSQGLEDVLELLQQVTKICAQKEAEVRTLLNFPPIFCLFYISLLAKTQRR